MSSAFYRTGEWRRLRADCIRLYPICATAGCGQPSRVADHVLPRSQGGADSLANLVGRCITCHNARRGTAEPRLRGAELDGRPRDRAHWWNVGNLSGLGAGTASGAQPQVSSAARGGQRRG